MNFYLVKQLFPSLYDQNFISHFVTINSLHKITFSTTNTFFIIHFCIINEAFFHTYCNKILSVKIISNFIFLVIHYHFTFNKHFIFKILFIAFHVQNLNSIYRHCTIKLKYKELSLILIPFLHVAILVFQLFTSHFLMSHKF